MFKVDSENMIIYITRGDSASIIFSAKDKNGEVFHPTAGDRLTFAVAKKFGDEPLIEIINEMGSSEEDFWAVNLLSEHTNDLKFGKYNFDVQVEMVDAITGEVTAVNTIIGKTDDITPYFIIWGEISPEEE